MKAHKLSILSKIYNRESTKVIMVFYAYQWDKLIEGCEDTLGWDSNLTVRI